MADQRGDVVFGLWADGDKGPSDTIEMDPCLGLGFEVGVGRSGGFDARVTSEEAVDVGWALGAAVDVSHGGGVFDASDRCEDHDSR